MTLRQRLKDDITAAMRSGEALRRDTLRMAENAIYNAEKRDRRTYTDDEVAAVLAKEVKTRRESVEAFRAGNREDLAGKEEREIAILSDYLPTQLTDDEVEALVGEAIAATGAATSRDMGRVMGWLSPRTKGRADGRRVSELVNRRLAGGGA
ncbi:MAG TPA: GatB/YqeY domain-containing protein [Candidatus Limnocylindrales bacterium]